MKKNILVADDDYKVAELIKVRLEEKGYSVVLAYDGEKALELARTLKPDLLILDVTMPKLDGDQVYMTLHSEPATKKMPILMLTGLRSEDEIEEMHEENIFSKPVQFEKLFDKIKQLLGE